MAPDPGNFDDSGPKHIGAGGSSPKTIDWDNEEHCRCVAACLVKGTSVMCGKKPTLAPAWSENFHFRRREALTVTRRNGDELIFGAIYERMPDAPRHPSAPHYIVAFRGTKLKYAMKQDFHDDCHIATNTLRDTERYRRVREAVDKLLIVNKDEANYPDSSCVVWLAGHSLGAALALEVGRAIMTPENEKDQPASLPTFLFNPPRVSLAMVVDKLLPKEELKRALYTASNTVKVGVVLVLSDHQKHTKKIFEQLAKWVPNLYVHEKDLISNGLIGHYCRPQLLHEWCSPDIAKAGMQLSHRDMFWSMFGQEKMQLCLLPSVMLWINSSVDEQPGNGFEQWLEAHKLGQWLEAHKLGQWLDLEAHKLRQWLEAHKLRQWWKPNSKLSLSPRRHIFFEDMHAYGNTDTDTVIYTTVCQNP